MTTERITKSIDDLILDPNNYRFIDKPEYRFVPEDQVDDTRVQQRTIGLITGKNQDNFHLGKFCDDKQRTSFNIHGSE